MKNTMSRIVCLALIVAVLLGASLPTLAAHASTDGLPPSIGPVYPERVCKIYVYLVINGHRYWVWSGATRRC
jgi:hypothetical protein